jgi:FkbM family methyltransferase
MNAFVWRTFTSIVARPYIYWELPGWGRLVKSIIGDYRHERLWRGQRKYVVDKRTGYKLDLDLGWWSDRMTFFLGRWYDLESQLVVDRHVKPGDIVVDVGANRGMFALYAAKRAGSRGRVICFEPNPTCIATLSHAIRTNRISNIEVRNVGLSDKADILNLMVPIGDTGMGTFASFGPDVDEVAVQCTVQVGDDALRDIAPNFIKIDVEGFEPKVIRGLKETIRRNQPIIYMEMVSSNLERAGSSAKELFGVMSEIGYRGLRVSYRSRKQKDCTYEELTEPLSDCEVLWLPAADAKTEQNPTIKHSTP